MDAQEKRTALTEQLRQLQKDERELSIKLGMIKKDQQLINRELWQIDNGIAIGDTVTFVDSYTKEKCTAILTRLDVDRTNNVQCIVSMCKKDGSPVNRERVVDYNEQKTFKKVTSKK